MSEINKATRRLLAGFTLGLLALMLAACGGGDSKDLIPGNGGTGTGDGDQAGFSVSVSLTDLSGGAIGSAANPISADNPARVRAFVAQDGVPQAGVIVEFQATLGQLSPESATALTNDSGVATIVLRAGEVEGAGQLMAAIPNTEAQDFVNFETLGDATGGGGTVDNSNALSLVLRDQNDTVNISEISQDQLGFLKACLVDSEGGPVPGEVIVFQTSLGVISPASGTALTQNDGCASVNLSAGSSAGAATASAAYGNLNATVNFVTDGSGSDVQVGTISFIQMPTEINSSQPENITVEVRNSSGATQQNKIVVFSTDLGTLSPSTGKVLTDASGQATVSLDIGKDSGAGTVEASTDFDNQTVVEERVFNAVQDEVQFGFDDGVSFQQDVLGLSNDEIFAGSTITVSGNLRNVTADAPYTDETEVTFQSVNCATSQVEASKTARSGIVVVTYTAGAGCDTDSVRAFATVNGEQLEAQSGTITIENAAPSSIEYLGSDPEDGQLSIKGSASVGGQESATLFFLVKDENGTPLTSPTDVTFTLSTTIGGIVFAGGQTEIVRQSNSQGEVSVQVNSGTVPTSLAVQATLTDSPAVTTSTNALSIAAGLPVQENFRIAVGSENPSPAGGGFLNTPTQVIASAADQFGNPVPDGTNIQFVAELGKIGSSCQTVEGTCSVTWNSQGAREEKFDPFKKTRTCVSAENPNEFVSQYGVARGHCGFHDRFGRSTVLVYTPGVESFIDTNGDSIWGTAADNSDRVYVDLPDPFLDANETGLYGDPPNNVFFNIENLSSYQQRNGQYNGINGDCSQGGDCRAYVRRQLVIVSSTRGLQFAVFGKNADRSNAEWVSKSARAIDSTSTESPSAWADAEYVNVTKAGDIEGVDVDSEGIIRSVDYSKVGSFGFTVFVADLNGNAPEQGTVVSVDPGDMYIAAGSAECTVQSTTEPYECKFSLTRNPEGENFLPVVVEVEAPTGFADIHVINVNQPDPEPDP
tara:strand:+ start:3935 stop:6892 length:2958 start_codon:yes stop_codon:yes gene_type:complete